MGIQDGWLALSHLADSHQFKREQDLGRYPPTFSKRDWDAARGRIP
jgi:hypothetical protein